jgi:hypothetical protein
VQGPLASIPEKHILHDMLRLFRKWRLIRRLHNESLIRIANQGNGWVLRENQVRVVKGVFAQETASHFPWKKWAGLKYKNRKSNEINALLDSCIGDGLIDAIQVDGRFLIRNSNKGENFYDYMDFWREFFDRYEKPWMRIFAIAAYIPVFVAGLKMKDIWLSLYRFIEHLH